MGTTDSIPVVSQAKSLVQSVCGDNEGAERTQENFIHECPVVSQMTSTVELIVGDTEGAIETQKRCGKGLMRAADGIPLVGHVKGVMHYGVGDKEGGHQAMKAATRTTGVMAGGAGAFLVGGPVAAVAGGVITGVEMDMLTTAITGQDAGYVAAIDNAVKNPNPGDLFDLALMPVGDGLAGYGAGEMVKSVQQPTINKSAAAHSDSTASNVVGNTQMATRLEVESYMIIERAQASTSSASLKAPGYYQLSKEDLQNIFDRDPSIHPKTQEITSPPAPSELDEQIPLVELTGRDNTSLEAPGEDTSLKWKPDTENFEMNLEKLEMINQNTQVSTA